MSMRIWSRSVAVLATALAAFGAVCATAAPGAQADQAERDLAEFLQDHPDARQTSPYQVEFRNGARMNFPPAGRKAVSNDPRYRPEMTNLTTSTVHGCPSGWYCFYENASYGGRMLQFQDCSGGGTTQFLSNYGFANQTTAWVNARPTGWVDVFSSSAWLWTERWGTSSSNVGTANNDKAYYFTCYIGT